MDAKYEFYEIVRVKSDVKSGEVGAVLGRAQNEQGKWFYAVALYSDDNLTWNFEEDELEPTGKKDKRETFYDGTSIRVKVDPDTGEGSISEED